MPKILKLIKSFRNQYVNIIYLLKILKFYKVIIASNDIKITGTGVLQLFFDDNIIKIPLGELSEINLQNEYSNYRQLKRTNLAKYVDYKLQRGDGFYRISRLKTAKDINILEIIDDLEKENTKEDSLTLSFDLLNKWCKKNFKYNFKYKKSVMHGDLTPENVMLNENNRVVFIDLDRFHFCGIKGLDKLHYFIEKDSREKNIDFFEWILENFDQCDIDILFVYFVYRVNIEHFDKVKLPHYYYQKACRVFDRFIEELDCEL